MICLIVYNICLFVELIIFFVYLMYYKVKNNICICFVLFESDLFGNGVWWCNSFNGFNVSNGNDKWYGIKFGF